ncbi:MAG: hypothetical protein M3O50_20575 [Myxococcota bacterium]|nr:hypothetical protein [Myxococcota bacterium]
MINPLYPFGPSCASSLTVALVLLFGGCDRPSASSSLERSASSFSEGGLAPGRAQGDPCGAWECRQYDTPADAFRVAIGRAPLVIGIGEAHAPRSARVPSAAKRFTEELLPVLRGRASDLLVELMQPPAGCEDASANVRARQTLITSQQAVDSQSDYVLLGARARSDGIIPDLLRPSCADLEAVQRAGDEAIAVSLETIARLSIVQAERLVDRARRSASDQGKAVVLYGGALHNDLTPAPERARWSYGPSLDGYVGGRFVAVDLIVPEFIGDDEAWRSLVWWAWWSSQDRAPLGARATLLHVGERSHVLIFPRTKAAAP